MRDTALEGIKGLLQDSGDAMKYFKKATYEQSFEAYVEKHKAALDAAAAVYDEEGEAWLLELADVLVSSAQAELDSISGKAKKNQRQMDLNMVMVTYLLPAVLQLPRGYQGIPAEGPYAWKEKLADAIVEKWNQHFKMNLGKATYDQIASGFQKKLCYITTAVCESLGKPDDCYELTLLRNYRDTYLLEREEGEQIVTEYYNIAPTIVNRIQKSENSRSVFQEIWQTYLSPCVKMIEEDRLEDCKEHYIQMVTDLRRRYMEA